MPSTQTQIAGFRFNNCLTSAAGITCMTVAELEEVGNSSAGSFVTKTATLDFRAGNPKPHYRDVPLGSISSMGSPNQSIDYYLDYLLELRNKVPGRTFFLSLIGMSPDETHTLLRRVQQSGSNGPIELDLSCPSVPGKPQIAYDFDTTEATLTDIFSYFTKPLDIKLPPYFDFAHSDQAAAMFNRSPLKFVNCVNSIGNGLYIESETVVIRPKNSFDGIDGAHIKPTALVNVHAFYCRLKPEIQIIGTGGVTSGRDTFEHILCGAGMVQIGTTLHQKGVAAFDRIGAELKAIMTEKGYNSLNDFRGRPKYLGWCGYTAAGFLL